MALWLYIGYALMMPHFRALAGAAVRFLRKQGIRQMSLQGKVFAGAAAALPILFVTLVPFESRVEAPFVVAAAERVLVRSTEDGRIASLHVAEGQQVAKGDIVAQLAAPALTLALKQAEAELAIQKLGSGSRGLLPGTADQ